MSVVEGRVSGAGEERIEFEEVPGADAVMVNDFDAVYIGYEVSVPPETRSVSDGATGEESAAYESR